MNATHSSAIAARHAHRRRGVVAVKVALLSVVLIGFVALGVDVGVMYNARQELQRATTAASMAAAAMYAQSGSNPNAETLARQAAADCASQNSVASVGLTLVTSQDVIFGQAERPKAGEPFVFTPDKQPFNAVRVIGRRTNDAPDKGIPLQFARIFGKSFAEVTCVATAMMQPRDMAIVADMSNSLNNDSELRHLRRTFINLHEVWANPKGFERGAWPGWDPADLQAAGWGWGFFKEPGRGFGYDSRGPGPQIDPLASVELNPDPNLYDPKFDVGLVKLPMPEPVLPFIKAHWDPDKSKDYQALESYLSNTRGYQGDFKTAHSEAWAILGDVSNPFDPKGRFENWKKRVAVATGFADWNSGIEVADPDPNKKAWWEKKGLKKVGNGDEVLDDNEMIWSYQGNVEARARLRQSSTPEYMKELWLGDPGRKPPLMGYAEYVSKKDSTMATAAFQGDSDFQWRFGIKTFMNFLLDKRPSFADTPEFATARAQPMQSVKEAVGALADEMSSDIHDQLALIVFGTTAVSEVPLTTEVHSVPDRLSEMQAGYYDSYTNIAAGIREGRKALTSGPPGRPSATKVIILLSDGIPTAYEDAAGNISTGSDDKNVKNAKDAARKEAQLANEAGIQIFAISTGSQGDPDFMKELADITGGRSFPVSGLTIDQYAAQLKATFITIASIKPVALIE